jgi:hypothetical protein
MRIRKQNSRIFDWVNVRDDMHKGVTREYGHAIYEHAAYSEVWNFKDRRAREVRCTFTFHGNTTSDSQTFVPYVYRK